MEDLEKIEVIRDRLGVTYAEAREALEACNGDLVEALVAVEKKQHCFSSQLEERGRETMERAKEWLSRSNSTRVKLKKGERTVLEIPASVGMAGLVAVVLNAPLAVASALGAVAAMAKNYHLDIEKPQKEE